MFRSRLERLLVVGGVIGAMAAFGRYLGSHVWRRDIVAPSRFVAVASPTILGDSGQRHGLAAIGAVILLAASVGGWSWWNASRHRAEFRSALIEGDPGRAPDLVRRYGCGGCHTLTSVRGAAGRVGPPLDTVGQRVFLAGRLPNTPENLARWIHDPHGVDPQTAMPNTGISIDDARNVAAYLLQEAPR
ncbi:c-type cytochrome [Alsobacter soli]|uniref:c-type cytochrome n=1 Tax=Alsobacter soli TaxID=2109933 RepID=UPI001FE15EE7|nr:c-type cytochrome [Alsobacter soli]